MILFGGFVGRLVLVYLVWALSSGVFARGGLFILGARLCQFCIAGLIVGRDILKWFIHVVTTLARTGHVLYVYLQTST